MQSKLLLAVLLVVVSSQATAADLHDATRSFEGLLDLIYLHSSEWNGRLRGYATSIFWSLVIIQMVWKFGMMALKQPDWNEFAAEFFRFTVIVGFFAALLLYSVEWAGAVVDSFRQAGAHAAGVGVNTKLMPGDMFGLAIKLGKTVGEVQTLNPVLAVTVSIAAVIILLCFVFIAAFMQVPIIESYIVINASVLFMAFGGSEWTREYAMAMIRYSVAVGAKLFVLTLIVGLIMDSAHNWQAAYNAQQDSASMWTMVGLAFVCAYLAKTIPDVIQGLITGVSVSGGSALGGMAATMTAGVAAGIALASTKMGGLGGLMSGASGGVADLLRSSGSGGSGGGGGGGYSSSMNSSSSSGSGGGGSSGSRTTSSRTGGGGSSFSGSTNPAPSPAPTQSAAAKGASGIAHAATAAAVKTGGVLSAIAVPGMESAANLSVGPAPTPPEFESPQDAPENIIRPESAPSQEDRAENINRPPEAGGSYDDNGLLTMEGLREKFNNQGKT
jgi:type IV secretion system protein TrbL